MYQEPPKIMMQNDNNLSEISSEISEMNDSL